MYQIEMDSGCVHESIGHSSNSSEYVMILEGQMILDVNGSEYRLEADDALYFDASYPHVYKNVSGFVSGTTLFISNIPQMKMQLSPKVQNPGNPQTDPKYKKE
jgi:quercetin dioxygenase-like cupin family protein